MGLNKNVASISTRFKLDVTGDLKDLNFMSVSGISFSTTPAETKDLSTSLRNITKLPGTQEPTDLTLSRPVDDNKALWDWFKKFRGGQGFLNGSLVSFGFDDKELMRWDFIEAWPSKVSCSGFDVAGKDVVTEEITLVTYDFHRVK